MHSDLTDQVLTIINQIMKRNPSKSSYAKNKTISTVQDSNTRKNSRIVKATSCIRIQNPHLQQYPNAQSHPHLKKLQQNYPYPNQMQMPKANTLHIKESRAKNKSSIQTVKHKKDVLHINDKQGDMAHIIAKNNQLIAQNNALKSKCCDLEVSSLKDKQKIKNLLIRISEVRQSRVNLQVHHGQVHNGQAMHNGQSNGMRSVHPSKGHLFAVSNTKSKDIITPYKQIQAVQCQSKECHDRKRYLQSQLYKQRIRRDQLQLQRKDWQKNRDQLRHQYKQLLQQIQYLKENQL